MSILLLLPMSIFSQFSGKLLLKPSRIFKENHPERSPLGNNPSDYGLVAERMRFEVEAGLEIAGYFIHALTPTPKGTIMILHGIGSCKEHSLLKAKMAAESGFRAVIYDARAHGESEGEHCTFGIEESKDVSKILDILEVSHPTQLPYFIWGHSLGGAVALLALENEPRFKAGVIESTFTSLDQVAVDYMSNIFGFGRKKITDKLLLRMGKQANIDLLSIKPIEAAKNIKVPVMIAHGEKDERVKFEYGKILYENLGSTVKKFVAVPSAGHIDLWTTEGCREYLQLVMNFFSEQGTH